MVKLSPKQLDSLGSTTTVFQFERCQRRTLTEDLDLEIYEFADFSLDGGGWVVITLVSSNQSSSIRPAVVPVRHARTVAAPAFWFIRSLSSFARRPLVLPMNANNGGLGLRRNLTRPPHLALHRIALDCVGPLTDDPYYHRPICLQSPNPAVSTLAQGDDGIHFRRAACWEIARQRGHCK